VGPDARPLPALQRAYFYLVSLVAVFMVVLGVANLLRVGAELVFPAQFTGFDGLPFLYWDYSRPSDVDREQASLAIALVAIGAPVWLFHFRGADRAAHASVVERSSATRSFYIHAVVFLTGLLVLGYGQHALGLVLQGLSFGSGPQQVPVGGGRFVPGFGLSTEWPARAAGAGAMAVTASVVFAYHLRLSTADRRVVLFAGRAAQLRHLALYVLMLAGLAWGSYSAINALSQIWLYVADQLVTPAVGTTFAPPPDYLRFQLLGIVPGVVAGFALWLGTWIALQRGVRGATPDGEIERRSSIRKLTVYLIVLISALAVLASGTAALTAIGRRLLGDPIVERFTTLHREIGTPMVTVIVFGLVWIFYRRAIAVDAGLEPERERAATIRRVYTYLIAGIGMAMLAIGLASVVGVLGSQLMNIRHHPNSETATAISIVLLGAPAWALSWWQARRRLDDEERRSAPRRGYVYLAVLAGVLGLLVFGSALLYRLLNASFAGSLFTIATWHDIWHFLVDATVSAAVFLFHYRVLRADRSAQLVTELAPHALTVMVRASDAAAARARLAAVLEGQADISIG
jgi:cytochrome b561